MSNIYDGCEDDIIDDDYCRAVSEAYWAEEEEYRLGIHPEQVKERIKKELGEGNYEITFLDWSNDGPKVRVYVDNEFYSTFDYEENYFQSTPGSRLEETLEINGFGLYNDD